MHDDTVGQPIPVDLQVYRGWRMGLTPGRISVLWKLPIRAVERMCRHHGFRHTEAYDGCRDCQLYELEAIQQRRLQGERRHRRNLRN